jgi:hypothetical protein
MFGQYGCFGAIRQVLRSCPEGSFSCSKKFGVSVGKTETGKLMPG